MHIFCISTEKKGTFVKLNKGKTLHLHSEIPYHHYYQYLKTTNNMKALNFIAAFIGGMAVGAAAGILLAPEKGADTRERIAEALRKRGIKLNRREMNALVDDISEELANANDEE